MIEIPSVSPYALDSRFRIGNLDSCHYGIQRIAVFESNGEIPLVVILYENMCQWRPGRGSIWYYEERYWAESCRELFRRRIHYLFPFLYPNEWDLKRSVLRGRLFYYRKNDFWGSRQWLQCNYGPSVLGRFEDMLRLFWNWLHGNIELG
jgi:hypothetical protein